MSEEGGPDYVQSGKRRDRYNYSVRQEDGSIFIRYNFPPAAGDPREIPIVIAYTVSGVLCDITRNLYQLYWKAIPAGNPFPVRTSVISVHLPEGVTFTNYDVYGAETS